MYGRNLVYPRTTNNNLFLLSPIRVCVCLGNVECITTQNIIPFQIQFHQFAIAAYISNSV